MAACEKCWNDAFFLGVAGGSQAERYCGLLEIRKNNPCTPEQQAGTDALMCDFCKRKSVHPTLKQCMNMDCLKQSSVQGAVSANAENKK